MCVFLVNEFFDKEELYILFSSIITAFIYVYFYMFYLLGYIARDLGDLMREIRCTNARDWVHKCERLGAQLREI